MSPSNFPESNIVFKRPPDMDASQCFDIHGWQGEIDSGSLEGMPCTMVAYELDKEDLERLNNGGKIYMLLFGRMMMHTIATEMPIKILKL